MILRMEDKSMNQVTLKVEGMMCGKCEAHVNEAVEKAVPGAKKVRSSHETGETSFRTDAEIDNDAIIAAVGEAGYTVTDVNVTPVEKKVLFGH